MSTSHLTIKSCPILNLKPMFSEPDWTSNRFTGSLVGPVVEPVGPDLRTEYIYMYVCIV